jgi:SIR2-like domain
MLSRRTVLVVGAGANVLYGFPTGATLIDQIVSGGGSTRRIHSALGDCGFGGQEIDELVEILSRTQFNSIDVFLQHHPTLVDIGRSAIAAVIMWCEDEDRLLRPPSTPGQVLEHWYRELFNVLIRSGEYDSSNLAIITLNYDRSLEQYLFLAVREVTQDDSRAAAAVLQSPFIHVHGALGRLPWMPTSQSDYTRPYAPAPFAHDIRAAANEIRILSEGRATDPVFAEARAVLADAQVIGFLGFGYHPEILRRLGFPDISQQHASLPKPRQPMYHGSTYHLPDRVLHHAREAFFVGPELLVFSQTVFATIVNTPLLAYSRLPDSGVKPLT